MSVRSTNPLQGLCIPALSFDDIASDSSFTQEGPLPGKMTTSEPYAKVRPYTSGAQGADMDVIIAQGGNMQRDGGMQASYRIQGEGNDDYRGWIAPNVLLDCIPVHHNTSNTDSRFDVAVIPSTQTVVCVYVDITTVATPTARIFDESTKDWGAAFTIPVGLSHDIVALTALDDDTLVLFGAEGAGARTYLNTNEGAAIDWALFSDNPLNSTVPWTIASATIHAHGDTVILFLEERGAGNDVQQYASNSAGAQFAIVGATFANFGHHISCASTPAGTLIVAYTEHSTNKPKCVRISNAFTSIAGQTKIAIDSVVARTVGTLWVTCDPNGTLYAFGKSTTTIDYIYAWVSKDDGLTWLPFDYGAFATNVTTQNVYDHKSAWVRGGMVALAKSNSTGGTIDETIKSYWYGGYLNGAIAGTSSLVQTRKAYGPGGTAGSTECYVPIDLPTNQGWALTGTAMTLHTNGALRMSLSSAGPSHYNKAMTSGGSVGMSHLVAIQMVSGGLTTKADCAYRLRTAGNTELYVRFATTGFAIYDSKAATTLVTVSADLTKKTFIFFNYATNTLFDCQYWQAGDSFMTEALAQTSLGTGGSEVNERAFGAFNGTATVTVDFWMFNTGHSVQLLRNIQGTGIGIPLLGLWPLGYEMDTADGKATYLSAFDGPAALGELFSIARRYTYGIERAIMSEWPSPVTEWRSEDTSQQVIIWDVGATTLDHMLGNAWAWGFYIKGANWRTATIDYWDGSTWQNVDTLDLQVGAAINFTRTGSILYGDGTTDFGRYLIENEYAGGWLRAPTASGTPAYVGKRIERHTAGVINSDATQPQCYFNIDGTAGVLASTGAMQLISHEGLFLHFPAAVEAVRRIRITIPTQDCPDAYFRAAIIEPVYFAPLGGRWSQGYTKSLEVNAIAQPDGMGSEIRRKVGEPPRSWSLPFQDILTGKQINGAAVSRHIGQDGGLPLRAAGDVLESFRAILQQLNSGALPCVAVSRLPDDLDFTLVEPRKMLYGVLDSVPTKQNSAGDEEQTDEASRGSALVVRELV